MLAIVTLKYCRFNIFRCLIFIIFITGCNQTIGKRFIISVNYRFEAWNQELANV
jgi:hypothetical protein